MTEKKYRVHDWVKFNYSEIGEYIGEDYTDKPLRNDEIVDLLNELAEENKELKEENQKLLSLIQGVDSWNSEKKDEHLAWKRVDVE